MIELILPTADPCEARSAEDAGVDIIFVDLEHINKRERQRGRDTFISSATIDDVARVRGVLTSSKLLVRVNPIHPGSPAEIRRAINDGADIVMLPMVVDSADVREFVALVAGDAQTCLLLETAQSLARIDEIVSTTGAELAYIGLNDLHLSMRLSFMFELLAGGIVEYMASRIAANNLPFGFGGIARIGAGAIPAEMILAEHIRLGSTMVILSRGFRDRDSGSLQDLATEVQKVRVAEASISTWSSDSFKANREQMLAKVRELVAPLS